MAHQRWLAQGQKDGRTLGAHLKAAAKLDQRAAADLAGPLAPQECLHILGWFWELSAARPQHSSSFSSAGGFAASSSVVPISYGEIESWARLTERQPHAWEVELLRALDAVWLASPKNHWSDRDGDRGDGNA